MKGIILFDGVCDLCTSTVQFIIKRDPQAKFKFTSLQGDAGKRYLKEYSLDDELNSLVFIDSRKNIVYTKSTAALLICRELSGPVRFLYPLILVPRPLRDFVYRIIANNRYKWFGKKEECLLPSPELNDRFIH